MKFLQFRQDSNICTSDQQSDGDLGSQNSSNESCVPCEAGYHADSTGELCS